MSRHGYRGVLPACPGAPAPADWHPWTSGPFTIATSIAGTQVQPCLTSIEVAPRAGGWQISLIEPANTLTFPVGTGDWTISDHADHHGETIPVAASGSWLDGHTLGTPHPKANPQHVAARSPESASRPPYCSPGRRQLRTFCVAVDLG
jgi:hypothetical protein